MALYAPGETPSQVLPLCQSQGDGDPHTGFCEQRGSVQGIAYDSLSSPHQGCLMRQCPERLFESSADFHPLHSAVLSLHCFLDLQIPTALSLLCYTWNVYSGPGGGVCTPLVPPVGIRVKASCVPTSPSPALPGCQQKGQLLPAAFSYSFSSSSGIHGLLMLQ